MKENKKEVSKKNIKEIQRELAEAKDFIKASIRFTLPVLNDKQVELAGKRLKFESNGFKVWIMADRYLEKSLEIIEKFESNQ